MIRFFVRNALTLQLFILAAAFSWIHGGTRPDLLLPVIPWLTAFVIEMFLVFPQARSTETLSEARQRVCYHLMRDPLLYFSIALTVLLVIPLFNVAGEPMFNQATNAWVNPKPPFPWLPSCVAADEHASLLLWFPPVLASALAVKHGLLKRGKRLLLALLCWNGAALSAFGFLQRATGATSVFWGPEKFSDFFSTFGYPNIAGAFFTLLFAISFGMWFAHISKETVGPAVTASLAARDEKESFWIRHQMLVPVALNFSGAIATLSRAAILLTIVALFVLGVYMIFGMWQKADASGKVKIVFSLLAVLLCIGLGMTVFGSSGLHRELSTITPTAIFDRVSGRGQYHARVARQIFNDHPAFGVGGWGYPYYQVEYMTPEELKSMQVVGGANVHNDTLQFLAEQGWTGFGLMLLCAFSVIIPAWIPIVRCCRLSFKTGQPVPSPRVIYCLPPEVIAILVGTCATVVHSMGDLPFRDPAVLFVWLCAIAVIPGFIPNSPRP
jgi:hypothetical protein